MSVLLRNWPVNRIRRLLISSKDVEVLERARLIPSLCENSGVQQPSTLLPVRKENTVLEGNGQSDWIMLPE